MNVFHRLSGTGNGSCILSIILLIAEKISLRRWISRNIILNGARNNCNYSTPISILFLPTGTTDISENGLKYILVRVHNNIQSVLDVGCGKGFLLQLIHQHYPSLTLHGADFVAQPAMQLPFTQTDARNSAICRSSHLTLLFVRIPSNIFTRHMNW